MPKHAINPTRKENYPEWYQQVIKAADLAEVSPVRGCMIIKPWGYGIWELIQQQLDQQIKETGHENIYCPLFIPLSFLEKEADHVDGFAKECAVVTHSKLVQDEQGKLVPASPLEEPLIVRPTSEAIIGDAMSRWVQSWRDLPCMINQWANVVRWEMRTRMFLRTTEFLWQEGHTAHATEEEAQHEAETMLQEYVKFAEQTLAMPVIVGEKSASERFPGAKATYCIEAMMQDKKALQAGTSHFLAQSFSKAFNIQFTDQEGQLQHAWTTSWGVSTRLIGGLIMTHSDDDGLILPPKVAPQQIVIIPILRKNTDEEAILQYCNSIAQALGKVHYDQAPLRVHVDRKTHLKGRNWHWIKKGAPMRIEVGQQELDKKILSVVMRHESPQDRQSFDLEQLVLKAPQFLASMQQHCFDKALAFQKENTTVIENKEAFYQHFADDNLKGNGFVLAHWDGNEETEEMIKKDLKVTIRCIPFEASEAGICPFTGNPSAQMVIWAKSY